MQPTTTLPQMLRRLNRTEEKKALVIATKNNLPASREHHWFEGHTSQYRTRWLSRVS